MRVDVEEHTQRLNSLEGSSAPDPGQGGVKASGFLSRFGSSSSVASDPDQGDDLEGGSSVAPDPSQGGIEGSLEGFDPKTRVRAAVMCRYEMCKHEFTDGFGLIVFAWQMGV